MKKGIAIIVVGGKMGIWFAKYFLANGYEVMGYDMDNEIKTKGVSKANSLVGAVLKTEHVMLCTPTRRTPEIIRLIAKEMKRGSYLIEISSQKVKTAASLAKMPAKINPIPTCRDDTSNEPFFLQFLPHSSHSFTNSLQYISRAV